MKIITGLGRCGTSFIAGVLIEAGIKFRGIDSGFSVGAMAGWEDQRITKVNSIVAYGCPVQKAMEQCGFDCDTFISDLAGTFVKDPRFFHALEWWLDVDGAIEQIVYCKRDLDEVRISSQKARRGIGAHPGVSLEQFIATKGAREETVLKVIEHSGVPYVVLEYPNNITDVREMHKLADLIGAERKKIVKAWKQVRILR